MSWQLDSLSTAEESQFVPRTSAEDAPDDASISATEKCFAATQQAAAAGNARVLGDEGGIPTADDDESGISGGTICSTPKPSPFSSPDRQGGALQHDSSNSNNQAKDVVRGTDAEGAAKSVTSSASSLTEYELLGGLSSVGSVKVEDLMSEYADEEAKESIYAAESTEKQGAVDRGNDNQDRDLASSSLASMPNVRYLATKTRQSVISQPAKSVPQCVQSENGSEKDPSAFTHAVKSATSGNLREEVPKDDKETPAERGGNQGFLEAALRAAPTGRDVGADATVRKACLTPTKANIDRTTDSAAPYSARADETALTSPTVEKDVSFVKAAQLSDGNTEAGNVSLKKGASSGIVTELRSRLAFCTMTKAASAHDIIERDNVPTTETQEAVLGAIKPCAGREGKLQLAVGQRSGNGNVLTRLLSGPDAVKIYYAIILFTVISALLMCIYLHNTLFVQDDKPSVTEDDLRCFSNDMFSFAIPIWEFHLSPVFFESAEEADDLRCFRSEMFSFVSVHAWEFDLSPALFGPVEEEWPEEEASSWPGIVPTAFLAITLVCVFVLFLKKNSRCTLSEELPANVDERADLLANDGSVYLNNSADMSINLKKQTRPTLPEVLEEALPANVGEHEGLLANDGSIKSDRPQAPRKLLSKQRSATGHPPHVFSTGTEVGVIKHDSDGDCLFSGLAFGWNHLHPNSAPLDPIAVRQELALLVDENRMVVYNGLSLEKWIQMEFPCFSGGSEGVDVKGYVNRMLKGAWGGTVEMVLFSRYYRVSIVIYTEKRCVGGALWFHPQHVINETNSNQDTLHLLFRKDVHYDSIVKLSDLKNKALHCISHGTVGRMLTTQDTVLSFTSQKANLVWSDAAKKRKHDLKDRVERIKDTVEPAPISSDNTPVVASKTTDGHGTGNLKLTDGHKATVVNIEIGTLPDMESAATVEENTLLKTTKELNAEKSKFAEEHKATVNTTVENMEAGATASAEEEHNARIPNLMEEDKTKLANNMARAEVPLKEIVESVKARNVTLEQDNSELKTKNAELATLFRELLESKDRLEEEKNIFAQENDQLNLKVQSFEIGYASLEQDVATLEERSALTIQSIINSV